jgi:hypothetical protein
MQNRIRTVALANAVTATIAFMGLSPARGQDAQLRRLAIGKLLENGVSSTSSGRSWLLGRANKTTQIDAAYLYRDMVVVFGWVGSNIGLTTIINADTGAEELEFLDFYPHITARGLIIFERWYPHFSDAAIVSDAIQEFDLNQPVPHNVPTNADQNPTDRIGAVIYPVMPTPGVRHEIGHNFLITTDGTVLFIADVLSDGQLCFVRQPLQKGAALHDQRCVGPASFGATDLSELHVRDFKESAFGDLVLSVDVGRSGSTIPHEFYVDRNSLELLPHDVTRASDKGSLAVPWPVQRKALAVFGPVTVGEGAQDLINVRLTIDTVGHVSNAVVSGSSPDIRALVTTILLRWKFMPAVLDGRSTAIVTEFDTSVGELSKNPG